MIGRATLDRRELLIGAGTAWAGLALGAAPGWARKRPAPLAAGGTFAQGVASGVPRRTGVTLWSRVEGIEGAARVRLEVATDPGFSRVVHRSVVVADPDADHTLHARVTGLHPATEYFYRFETATAHSDVGRLRTLVPRDSQQPIRLGVWTCQDFRAGFYAGHADLARQDVDLVVCLGDYIYENGGSSPLAGRSDPMANPLSVDDYRGKYRRYRSDANLRALHAAHPFLMLWDDHEVVNDAWRDGHEGHADPGFAQRRANAYRAWFEHQPIPRIGGADSTRIYRSVRVGQADLFCLDERQYRDVQPCGDAILSPCPDADAPGRAFLGDAQKAWLQDGLRRSDAAWKVLLNGDMMMGLAQPLPETHKFVDTWDGYGAERAELTSSWLRDGLHDIVVLTGDDHDNYAGVVTTTGTTAGRAAAVEYVVPSVTSDNTSELLLGLGLTGAVSEVDTRLANPHLAYVDQRHHGYCLVDVASDAVTVRFRHVADRTDPRSPVTTARTFVTPRGQVAVEAG